MSLDCFSFYFHLFEIKNFFFGTTFVKCWIPSFWIYHDEKFVHVFVAQLSYQEQSVD